MNCNQTIFQNAQLSSEVTEKLLLSCAEAESLTMRNIRCPYCGFLVEKVYSDICGHKQVFCKKCKEKYIINLGYFRRQKKLKYFKIHFPDKTHRER